MKHVATVGTIAAVLMSVGLVAQGRNFSGNWTIDSEKTMAANPGTTAGGRGGGGGDPTMARRVNTGTGGTVVAAGGGGGAAVARSGSAGGGMVVATGTVLTVDAKSFTIAQGQTTTTYPLDGTVTDLNSARGKVVAKASWQGDKIAIETTTEGPNGPIVTHATWYLEAEWLVRENTSTGADGQPVVRKTYYKKG